MIHASLLLRGETPCGFCFTGHAGQAAQGQDIVCAAVSSAAYLAANTVTEVCGCHAAVQEREGCLQVLIPSGEEPCAQSILQGLWLHMEGLASQYPQHIHLQLTEV